MSDLEGGKRYDPAPGPRPEPPGIQGVRLELAPSAPLADVEWRVDRKPSNNRCRFVPYVGATTVARLLDEWLGPGAWSDAYEPGEVAGKPALWCYLSVKVGDEWVTKRDVGVASNFEAQKGMVSDAFKRAACVKWGVARNVWSLPTLWAPCNVDNNGKAWANDKTLPALHQELKRLGYEPTGKLAAQDESSGADVETAGTPASPPESGVPRAGGEVSATASQATLGGEAGPAPALPSEEAMQLSALIVAAVNDKRVAQLDVIEKATMLLERNDQAPPKDGIDGRTLPTLGILILRALVRDLGLEEKVGA